MHFHTLRIFHTPQIDFLQSVAFLVDNSQSASRMTSISENEMNIQIPLCNVRHLNRILNTSLEIFSKKAR